MFVDELNLIKLYLVLFILLYVKTPLVPKTYSLLQFVWRSTSFDILGIASPTRWPSISPASKPSDTWPCTQATAWTCKAEGGNRTSEPRIGSARSERVCGAIARWPRARFSASSPKQSPAHSHMQVAV